MSIKNNAVDSIALGLEDYATSVINKDERRIISCARNIYAGILLLFKHKISTVDEELLWVGKTRRKTVGYEEIKKVFEDKIDIQLEWSIIDKVNNYRNDAEHYFSTLEHKAVQGLISNSFIIIRDFVTTQLGEDPKELLGSDSWSTLIEIHEVYEKEKEDCNDKTRTLEFFSDTILEACISFSCKECGSELLYPTQLGINATDSDFICKSCDTEFSYAEIISPAIANYFVGELYVAMTDGGDSPIADCPFCGGPYLYKEEICAECGESASHDCDTCGATIPPEELSENSLCGYCAYQISKED